VNTTLIAIAAGLTGFLTGFVLAIFAAIDLASAVADLIRADEEVDATPEVDA